MAASAAGPRAVVLPSGPNTYDTRLTWLKERVANGLMLDLNTERAANGMDLFNDCLERDDRNNLKVYTVYQRLKTTCLANPPATANALIRLQDLLGFLEDALPANHSALLFYAETTHGPARGEYGTSCS
jgi:hypothetical protein